MEHAFHRFFLPLYGLAGSLGLISSACAAEPVLPCRPVLVSCNYAEHFSGTIHWRSLLKTAANAATGTPAEVEEDDVTITVLDGKPVCGGMVRGKRIQGAGKLAVERGISMEDAPDQPWYEISVSCPEPDGNVPDIMNTSIKTYKQKDTTVFKTLSGSLKEDHPDADPDNGVTGNIRLDWSLNRKGNAPL